MSRLSCIASRVAALPARVTLWTDTAGATLDPMSSPQTAPADSSQSRPELFVRACLICGDTEALRHLDLLVVMLMASMHVQRSKGKVTDAQAREFRGDWRPLTLLARLYPKLVGWVIGDTIVMDSGLEAKVKDAIASGAMKTRRMAAVKVLAWANSTTPCHTLASTPCHLLPIPSLAASILPGDRDQPGALPALHAARHDKTDSPPAGGARNAVQIARKPPAIRPDHPDGPAYLDDRFHVDRQYHSPGTLYRVERFYGHPGVSPWPRLEQSYARRPPAA